MSEHRYATGRLNLPFVGISTFGKRPYVVDWDAIDADVAVLGAPLGAEIIGRPQHSHICVSRISIRHIGALAKGGTAYKRQVQSPSGASMF